MANNSKTEQYQELKDTLKDIKHYFIYAGLFSAAINILMLTPIIYMLQVYDRVVSSGSLSTLTMLSLLGLGLLLALGGFEWVRSMILIGASNRIETKLRRRVYNATFKRALLTGGMNSNAQPIQDLTGLRQFLTGNGLFAFFDAPWFPIYIAVMFLFHPWFGVAGIIAGILMVILAIANEKATSEKLQKANQLNNNVTGQVGSTLKNSEVIAAMGMSDDLRHRQERNSDEVLQLQTAASRSGGLITSMTKSLRIIMQSALLGLGAYLALQQEITPGMMIAGSLLLGRALAPIDLLVGSWKGFSVARAQYARLGELLTAIPADAETMELPAPTGQLSVEQVMVAPPGAKSAVIRGISFQLEAGEALGIVGPSASGKSTLARALLGIWPAYSGKVRLDGADISAWDRVQLGPYIGYLPQDIELFDGSISENISRFGQLDSEMVVEAAKLAGVHELILKLPQGYDTVIGASGGALSGGQRQRIGLARAVYNNPKFMVLDEPNSNLDDQGERELVEALHRVKANGCTIIVISHRTMILQCVDKILAIKEGVAVSFGPKDQVLASLTGAAPQIPKSANG